MPNRLLNLITMILITFNLQSTAHADTDQPLKLVGEATLTKLFWTVYDCRLYTSSGVYNGIETGLVLAIVYQRKTSKQQLIISTKNEWQALSLFTPSSSEQWLQELEKFWPDVDQNDVIELKVNQQLSSHFYFNGNAIGTIHSEIFTRRFLAIWLSSDSRYPKLQRQLTGLQK
jgi:hypothetical protein